MVKYYNLARWYLQMFGVCCCFIWYPRLCNYVVQFAILYFIAKATEKTSLCDRKLLKKATRMSEGNVHPRCSCSKHGVIFYIYTYIFVFLTYYLLSIYIYMYITYIFHQKQQGGPLFFPHVTVRFSCAKATYNNLCFFGGFVLILRVVKKLFWKELKN